VREICLLWLIQTYISSFRVKKGCDIVHILEQTNKALNMGLSPCFLIKVLNKSSPRHLKIVDWSIRRDFPNVTNMALLPD